MTMVMLVKYLLMELAPCNPKVVVVTDRKELDRQISTTFAHTRLNPATASSGRNLVKLLQSGKADVVTTIINKFNTAEKLEHRIFPEMFFCWWMKVTVPIMVYWPQKCGQYFPTPAILGSPELLS